MAYEKIRSDRVLSAHRKGIGGQFQMFGGGSTPAGDVALFDSNGDLIGGGSPGQLGGVGWGGGSPIAGNVPIFDANGDLVDGGSSPTSGEIQIRTGPDASKLVIKDGNLYLPNNGVYVRRDTGVAWANWGPIYPFTEPVLADFTAVNQETATAVTTYGGIYVNSSVQSGDDCRVWVKAAPATPYTATACFTTDATKINGPANVGILFRQSSDGKLSVINHRYETAVWHFSVVNYNSPTSFNAQPANVDPATHPYLVWFQISDNGTNRIYRYSLDGITWTQLYSIGRTTFLTADQIGFYVNSVHATLGVRMWLLHWFES